MPIITTNEKSCRRDEKMNAIVSLDSKIMAVRFLYVRTICHHMHLHTPYAYAYIGDKYVSNNDGSMIYERS